MSGVVPPAPLEDLVGHGLHPLVDGVAAALAGVVAYAVGGGRWVDDEEGDAERSMVHCS